MWMKTPPIVDPLEIPWKATPSNVVHLNENNFHDFLSDKKHVLVMFYVPWCPHSRDTMPEYDRAADDLIDNKDIYFAAVECIVTGDLCGDQEVDEYPDFKYFS